MAGELLRAVTERQDNVKRMVAGLVEELEALVMKFSYESSDGPTYHFEFNEVSLLYVSVTLLRNEKPVVTAWIMYHTDRNQFAFSEYEPSGDWPSMGYTCGLNKTLLTIADWLLLKIDAEERVGDKERLWSAACAALGKDAGKSEA